MTNHPSRHARAVTARCPPEHRPVEAADPRTRHDPDDPPAGHTGERITDLVLRQINHHDISYDAGNALLGALGLDPRHGDRRVSFRVPATIRTDAQRPGRAIEDANRTVRRRTDQMTWTRFAGCPAGYGIDPPTPDQPDQGTLTVHTDPYLSVTVPAYRPGELVATAYALLARDLLDQPDLPLRLHTDRIAYQPRPMRRIVDHEDWTAIEVQRPRHPRRCRDRGAAARPRLVTDLRAPERGGTSRHQGQG